MSADELPPISKIEADRVTRSRLSSKSCSPTRTPSHDLSKSKWRGMRSRGHAKRYGRDVSSNIRPASYVRRDLPR